MIAFLIISVAIVLWVQQWILENTPDFVEANFWPEENVVDPGDPFHIIIELKNKKAFPLYFIKINMSFPKEFQVDSNVKLVAKKYGVDDRSVSFSTWLKANQTLKLKVPVSISTRGRYIIQNPTLFFGDFLGLTEKRKELDYFREVVVAPETYVTNEVKQVLGKFLGEYSVRRFIYEDPVLTVGFRDYSGREPMKMISWKQSAQRGHLMVKEYDHTIEPVLSVLVNVETTNENAAESIEKAYSIARSVCSNLESKGISYDFYINALMAGGSGDKYMINDGLGSRHFAKVMELLGRGMQIHAFSYKKLVQLAKQTSGNERGLIIITPDTTVITQTGADSQILLLNATTL